MNKTNILSVVFIAVIISAVVSGCKDKRSRGLEYAPNMYEPLAYNPDQKNPNFADGKTSQTPPQGTNPIGFVRFEYPETKEGYEAAGVEAVNPLTVNKQTLEEGKQLYLAMCSPCHGEQGKGNGSIVESGKYPAPPSYSTGVSSRGGAMSELTDGKIFHTMQYGINLMGSYASQLSPEERWKVVAYVHELQKLK